MTPNGSRIKKLNRVDRQMVSLLQKDGRMPIVTIAKELGISETTARSRLKRLLADDVIKVVAVSNPIRLGFEIIGNIKLSIDLKEKDAILKALKDIDALNYVALTTGGNDIEFIAGSCPNSRRWYSKKLAGSMSVIALCSVFRLLKSVSCPYRFRPQPPA